ncbi:MAG: peptidylprolyl isomerase [Candidatus Azobacteroides pseudotrichonymphae]|jgi:peptidyl-prolyl cis-trans isomerase SurA|uniref:Peptidyl-prolyl cis-trans isomerase SurA n=1 Tax=Azobacteroides pseudotrichonymphae genomovar. CFP2 TaxID=511995 RepID=B6YRK2_AZOPC|nr:peptidylprolyl isomerase [Candidatus Azobacteroides pseudotrichonymphae]MDR0530174.1 peptidylprolyl isomerase [Bacteroidales bacterium OttesenSCG-928-I14]BAG83824.1 peptidyl-prolyl cis-trans isomerase SurA [Candidatus Azobacteroides pseudotrichonymphae genomovar. CFP2]GMO35576.1 MAG: peptidylprolyl isomerase [Candidatus Azobacteroides pseudotrichonymphae]
MTKSKGSVFLQNISKWLIYYVIHLNKFIHSIIVLTLVSSGLINAQSNVIDEVVWTIGNEVILRSDVENVRLQMQINNQYIEGDPYCVIPEQLAIQKLYLRQAKLDSINIPESQVSQMTESWINHLIDQIGSKEKVEEYCGKPISVLREEKKQAIREQGMIQAMQNKLVSGVKVTPSDIRNFYNQIPQDSLPFIPTTVEVEIITLKPLVTLEEINNIKQKLKEYIELVTSGQKEFSTLARLYSEDINSAMKGGELNFVCKSSLSPEFAAVAFELSNPKKVSRIVETEYGYHIIQLIEKKGDRINVRHILLKPHATKEELAKVSYRLDSIRTDIIRGKLTFEEAVTCVSQDKNTRNNKGLMVNYNGQVGIEHMITSHFEIRELPPEISKAIRGMQVGDISKPFTMINSEQKEVISIVKLKSRIECHKASFANDYQILKEILERKKQNQVLTEWLNRKKQETYIHISDNWKNCNYQIKGWHVE